MLDNSYTRHHKRFLIAAGLAFLAWWPLGSLPTTLRLLVVGDVFFLVYLVLILHMTMTTDLDGLRRRASTEDEGIVLISALTLAAVGLSLFSIFSLINEGSGQGRGLLIALVSVPLGWATLHAMAAQHYANLYYGQEKDEDGSAKDRGGLDFPGDGNPTPWDFLYFAFVIGMTAQTADVDISASGMRRVALAHSVAAFFFNTVLVALAVNVAVAAGAK